MQQSAEFQDLRTTFRRFVFPVTAFFLVSLSVPVLRKSRPDLKRSFKVPWSPWLPWLSAAICLFLMANLTAETWLRFLIWLVLGFVVYFAYSRSRSRLATGVGIRPDMLDAMGHGHAPQDPDDQR